MAAEELQFNQLLECLMSLDNNERSQAEARYAEIAFEPKIIFLVKCMRNPQINIASRTLSLVMLRRLISTSVDENWVSLNEQNKKLA